MEFEILNELLTCTVAQLFTDLGKHANFMKNSSQMGQDKSEIPKQLDYFSASNQSERSTMGPHDENSVGYWLQNDAKVKLQESLLKLGLDN